MKSGYRLNGFQGDAERYRPAGMSDFEFNSCWRKCNYRNEQTAIRTIEHLKTLPNYDASRPEPKPYVCPFCKSWHIGSRKIKQKFEEAKS